MNDSFVLYTHRVACTLRELPYAVENMMEQMKKSRFRTVFGVLLIVYGIVALIVPGIPGAWFIFIGLEFFGIRILWKDRLQAKWTLWREKRKEESSALPPQSPTL